MQVYTDGSANPNPGRGGYGLVFVENGEIIITCSCFGSEKTTNNIMELMAVIVAYQELTEYATIITDSEYVKKGLTIWSNTWIKNGWKTTTKQPVKNINLWKQLLELKKNKPFIKIEWIKAHNNNYFNELADNLAKQGAKQS